MDITVNQAIDNSRNLEKLLASQLAVNNVSYSQVEDTLSKIGAACSTALFYNFESAVAQHAEDRIWDSHQKVNAYYRAVLKKLKNSKEPTIVARRKLEASYLRFIKTAQKFYRGYIRDLAAIYGNVPELERAAKKVGGESQAKDTRRKQMAQRQLLLLSLHTTLIHLGDLSRYRESELSAKERNWGPAVGFYDLASSVLPGSGFSYNQLAVVALADGNLFRATYQLYRALCAEKPHPQAEPNLKKAFYQISEAWKNNELSKTPAMTAGAGLPQGLVAFYLWLVSNYYHGKSLAERESLENEILSQLAVDLKQRSTESSPAKLVMINIASGHAAQERLVASKGIGDTAQSYLFFLRLNIRTFLSLLRSFEAELEQCEVTPTTQQDLAKRATSAMQRTLPALRLYSLWLINSIEVMANEFNQDIAPLQAEFWAMYARVLSLVHAKFPVQNLPQPLKYMLDEDEDTIGFKPLDSDQNKYIWYEAGNLKSRTHDLAASERNVPAEMLSRMRDLLTVGVALAVNEKAPIQLDPATATFVYTASSTQKSAPAQIVSQTPEVQPATSSTAPVPITTEAQLATDDSDLNAMVDSLVGADEDDEPFVNRSSVNLPGLGANHRKPATPPSPFPTGTHTANDLLDVVRGWPQRAQSSPRSLSNSGLLTNDASRSPISAQALPRSPGLGNGSFSGWGTPPYQPAQAGSRPATAQTPLAPPPGLATHPDHSRMNSADSTGSPWMPDTTWSTFPPTDSQDTSRQRRSMFDRNLGNGTFGFGDTVARRESQFTRGDSFKGSPLLTTGDGWGTPERPAFGMGSPLYDRQLSFSGGPTTPTGTPIASIGTGRPRPIK